MNENFFPHIMEIALVVAQKIIKQEVQTSPELVNNIIMRTLDELNSEAEKITIKVNNPSSVQSSWGLGEWKKWLLAMMIDILSIQKN